MLNGLNADLLEIISIVSFDRHFAYSFADFYGAELSSSSNDYCSLGPDYMSRAGPVSRAGVTLQGSRHVC